MAEMVNVRIGDEWFDELVHGSPGNHPLPQYSETGAGIIDIAAKPKVMVSGAAGIVISFFTVLPDGNIKRVQATTSRAAFLNAATIIQNHPDLQ